LRFLCRNVDCAERRPFGDVLLRGDTDFSLTAQFDRWDDQGVRFVFGYDARANLMAKADDAPDELYHELVARAEREVATRPRPKNVKDAVVRARRFKVLRPKATGPGRVLLPARQVRQGLPGGRSAQEPVGRTGRGCLVLRAPVLFFCATRRSDISPTEWGGIGGDIPGPNGLPGLERERGQ